MMTTIPTTCTLAEPRWSSSMTSVWPTPWRSQPPVFWIRAGNDLEPPDREVTEHVSAAVTAFRSAVPRPGSVTLLEDLLASEPEVVLVALAERLDQVRHAHLWGDLSEARAVYQEASEVYLKIAERTHARLAARYASWCRSFGAKYLKNARD